MANAVLAQKDLEGGSGGGGGSSNRTTTVEISSKNLNITAESKSAAALADQPTVCKTGGAPAVVSLPSGVLGGTTANASLPVRIVAYSSSTNLHGPPPSTNNSNASAELAGPLISFTLRQGSSALAVANTSANINISLPLSTERASRLTAADGTLCLGSVRRFYSCSCRLRLTCRAHPWHTPYCGA